MSEYNILEKCSNLILQNVTRICTFIMSVGVIVCTVYVSDAAKTADPFGFCTLLLVAAFMMVWSLEG